MCSTADVAKISIGGYKSIKCRLILTYRTQITHKHSTFHCDKITSTNKIVRRALSLQDQFWRVNIKYPKLLPIKLGNLTTIIMIINTKTTLLVDIDHCYS